jgi:hypothetical protein
MSMKPIELLDIDGAKRMNIIEMGLAFTAMMRLFVKGSNNRIAAKLEELFLLLVDVRSAGEYDVRHRSFCDWFIRHVRTAEKKHLNGRVRAEGPSSYGQAAKVLDIAAKVYFHYCSQPTAEIAARMVPFLHGAIDTPILKHLKKSERARARVRAATIKEVDEDTYQHLQSLLARKSKNESSNRKLHAVEYDDILWRRLNRGAR